MSRVSTVPTGEGCFTRLAVIPAVAALLLVARKVRPRR